MGRYARGAGRTGAGPLAALALALLMTGCASSRPASVVGADTDRHLSGNWTDADSKAVAAGIGRSLLAGSWLATATARLGRPPIVRVGHVRVRVRDVDDVIATAVVTDDLERALIASGSVRVVASRDEAARSEGVRDTRAELARTAAAPPPPGVELVPDLVLSGRVRTQYDQILDRGLVSGTYQQVKFYQVTFTLTDLVSNEVLWSDSVERKKVIEQGTLGW